MCSRCGIKCTQAKSVHRTISAPNTRGLGVASLNVLLRHLFAAAVNVQVNRAALSRVPVASSPAEIVVYKFRRPRTECN